jgi:hypothetical protein
MTPKALELAEIASIVLMIVKDEVIASGDPEVISWARDQFRNVEAWVGRLVVEADIPAENPSHTWTRQPPQQVLACSNGRPSQNAVARTQHGSGRELGGGSRPG